jgi:hypothetical protein
MGLLELIYGPREQKPQPQRGYDRLYSYWLYADVQGVRPVTAPAAAGVLEVAFLGLRRTVVLERLLELVKETHQTQPKINIGSYDDSAAGDEVRQDVSCSRTDKKDYSSDQEIYFYRGFDAGDAQIRD